MNRDELDLMKQIVEESVANTDDYINWTFVQMVRKEADDQERNKGRSRSDVVGQRSDD